MSDVIVTPYTPRLASGHALRTYGIARALAAGGDGVDVAYVRFGAPEPDEAFRAVPGIRFHPVTSSRGPRRIAAYAELRALGAPAGFARVVSPELAATAAALADASPAGRVIADGPGAAAAIWRLAGRRPVVYSAQNVESAFRQELGRARVAAGRLRAFERRLMARAAETWMVSEADVAAAREICPAATVRCVPNVVDVAAIEPVRPAEGTRRAVFVGTFGYEPNHLALRWLLDEVLPRVWREVPDARLAVAGRGVDPAEAGDPRVEILGFVDDLAAVYGQASCAVVPLLHGGGTPLKFLEALAYGLPVVATTRAASGLAVRAGEHCLIAPDADGFASALVTALRGEASALGPRGRALVAERYSVEALTELLRTSGPTRQTPSSPTSTASISSQKSA